MFLTRLLKTTEIDLDLDTLGFRTSISAPLCQTCANTDSSVKPVEREQNGIALTEEQIRPGEDHLGITNRIFSSLGKPSQVS
jgi:hypothetical protein